MYFVSLIGIERAANVESLARLYEEVVEEYLNRDYGAGNNRATTPYRELVVGSGLMDAEGRTGIKTAMARVALTILAAGSDTRLQSLGNLRVEKVLDKLLKSPKSWRNPDWWPADSWWHRGRYYTRRFKKPARRALREFSFLQQDGNTFRFLHDSLLYYFAALAVRCKEEPEIELSSLDAEPARQSGATGRSNGCARCPLRGGNQASSLAGCLSRRNYRR